MKTPRLEFKCVSKRFGSVQALNGVSFTVARGSVHGLLGENGAGKSTLLKCLSGVYPPDSGTILIDGQSLSFSGPCSSRNAGIAMIHQELQYVPEMTVAQNLFLGCPIAKFAGILSDRVAQQAAAAKILHDFDPTIDPAQRISELRVAQKQLVEIARARIKDARVVAMDEPTSSLSKSEFEKLVILIDRLTEDGISVIYVSHRMDEIFRCCHFSTILRDGALVETVAMNQVTRDDLVQRMVGRTLKQVGHKSFAQREVALDVRGLARRPAVQPSSFSLHKGEVLGIAGLVGAGRTELLRLIAGLDAPSAGEVRVGDRRVPGHDVAAAIHAGISLLPEERKREGIIPMRSIASNIALPSLYRFSSAGLVHKGRVHKMAQRIMSELKLRPLNTKRYISAFSGGNQQKAIIARWLAAGAEVLLFDEPTRGIDIGAKSAIYALIENLASQGKALIVVSSELSELLRVADRVLVMCEGEITADLPENQITEEAIMHAAIPGYNADNRGRQQKSHRQAQ